MTLQAEEVKKFTKVFLLCAIKTTKRRRKASSLRERETEGEGTCLVLEYILNYLKILCTHDIVSFNRLPFAYKLFFKFFIK